jgi:hypothetical protein
MKMIQKDYNHRGSGAKIKFSGSEPQGAWRQDKLIDGKPPVAK